MNMENEQKKGDMNEGGHTCGHMGCGCGHHHKHALKWIIKIAALVLVFCFAFQMGELKGMMLSSRGYSGGYRTGMMFNQGDYGTPVQGYRMMQLPAQTPAANQGTSTTPSTPNNK